MIMFMCLLANIVIALLSAGLAGYTELGTDTEEEVYSNLMPLMSGFIISFFVGKLALGVWDCAATSILVCRCMLKEWFKKEFEEKSGKHAKKAKYRPEERV